MDFWTKNCFYLRCRNGCRNANNFLLGGHDGDNHHELERIINDMWGSGPYKEWTRIELFPMTGRAICLLKKKLVVFIYVLTIALLTWMCLTRFMIKSSKAIVLD